MTRERASAWGVVTGFHDIDGRWWEAPPETLDAVLAAMGAEAPEPPGGGALVVAQGELPPVPEPELVTETGDRIELAGGLPEDLPLGYHTLVGDHGQRRLIVSPDRCHLPQDLFGWGFAVQLYSLLSGRSLGIGDLGDLRELARWTGEELGGAFLLLNPLHAALPGRPQEPSPYYPSSRRFWNPLYLRLEEVEGVEPPSDAERERLSGGELVDRDAVSDVKLAALELAWERVGARLEPELEEYERRRPGLAEYATFCALSERFGRPWRRWPEEYRRPGSAAVARFAAEHRGRVRFHEWLQYELEAQLAAVRGCGLVADLAVGVHPDGADAWAWQAELAQGISIGAPPDPFNTAGQDWGLPPFDPWRLRAAGFQPFIETVRAAFRCAGGIRVDHVMGLFRLYWIPVGSTPAAGAYVRYPARELFGILALESVRAGAYVIGEDLGTVEDEVRDELARRDVLSYRLLWFDPAPPSRYPRQALAALTTHDLPTLMGVWTGADPMPEVRDRLSAAGIPAAASEAEVIERAHGLLAEAPCRLLAATLEDVSGVRERPNLPGTVAPGNWSRRLPLTLERLMEDERPRKVAAVLGGRRSRLDA